MSRKYYLWVKEKGQGCKYMVGCGEKLTHLDAATIEAARAEALRKLEWDGMYGSDREAEHVVIYSFEENMTHLYNEELAKRKSITDEQKKQKEIEELEGKLKKLKGAGT